MEKASRPVAFVAGGSGLIGHHLLDDLLASDFYRRIVALVRRPLERTAEQRLVQLSADFERLDALPASTVDLLNGADLFCTLGTTIKNAGSKEAFRAVDFNAVLAFADWGLRGGAARIFIVTALGANAHSSIFYNRVKGELEEELQRRAFKEIHIFRPSLLLGRRQEIRPGEKAAEYVFKALSSLSFGPLRPYFPIEASTVARAMLASATGRFETASRVRVHEPLAMRDLASRVKRVDK